MPNIDRVNLDNNTTYDIISKTGRGLVRATMNTSTSTSTAFVVTADSGIESLYDGLTIVCKNIKASSATNCTLNLNNLGAKRIWLSQSNNYCTIHWALNTTYIFVYDATNERWELQQGRDTDSDTQDVTTLRTQYSNPTTGVNGVKKYSLFARTEDSTYTSFTSTSGTGDKTYDTTTKFDLRKIFYYSGSSDVATNTALADNSLTYAIASINLRYTLNGITTDSTSTLAAKDPVYLIVEPCGNNLFCLASPYYTNAPLSVTNGYSFVYILIGYMRDTYRVDLLIDNQMYQWNDLSTGTKLVPYIEGYRTVVASGIGSHAEGQGTTASGTTAHAEGCGSVASGGRSHAEGYKTLASGMYAHAEGNNTIAKNSTQHVFGKYNIEDPSSSGVGALGTYVEIVGNGEQVSASQINRSNARTLDWNGNESIAGNLEFMESSNTGSNIPGIYWKELGYGDAFKIVPQFSGTGDQNYLTIKSSTGGSGETPVLSDSHRFYPSGGIMYRGTCNSVNTDVDVTQSNNGLSSNKYVGSYFQDVNNRSFGKFTSVALTDGTTALEMYTQNFNTSGASVGSNSFTMYMNKSGTASCNFSHPWAWLAALGLASGFKCALKQWQSSVKIRQCGGDWMCIIMCNNSIYTIRGGGGNHATMTPTFQLVAGNNESVTQSISHSTNYSEFTYSRSSNAGWVVLSFSTNTSNHEIS